MRNLRLVTIVMALTCGFTVANIYYSQPLLGLIASRFGVTESAAALIVTLTQLGYALGMILVVPLGDKLENRGLAAWTLLGTAAALLVAALAPTFSVFLAVSVLVGITSVVVQVIVPIAANLAPEGQGGRVVGQVMMGLLLGILLARTLSSFVAAAWGWQTIYLISAGVMVVLSITLFRVLPRRVPHSPATYWALVKSMGTLVRRHEPLRRRALSQALMFGAFTAYWTAISFHLISRFGFGQTAIGLFALVGAAGALAAPVAGRLADRGLGHVASGGALVLALLAAVIALVSGGDIVLLALGGVLLDFAVQSHQVIGQHEVYALDPGARSRINSVYMFTLFVGGSIASAITGALYSAGGWPVVCVFEAALPIVGLIIWGVHHVRHVRPGRLALPARG
ncbi:MFS transporter [Frondihabitans australicus]|uniref:Putative MFS family arabinose efflux permease n=1 Tax=Frondihabitans australicus TaxID=386892 RepID=A0A495IJM8_9MICO|nr:MFS transporter [Frondihabitans australicus]RKR75989.1 putative MFS family arabinose efflux permease [Frondihabitans australicus]